MKTVRFVRDTDPEREGGPGFKSGQVHSLKESSARHWYIRGAAVYVKDATAPAPKPSPAKADEPTNPPADAGKPEDAHGNAVEGSADVARDDSPGAGQRAEPAAKPAGGKGSGKGKGCGGNRG